MALLRDSVTSVHGSINTASLYRLLMPLNSNQILIPTTKGASSKRRSKTSSRFLASRVANDSLRAADISKTQMPLFKVY